MLMRSVFVLLDGVRRRELDIAVRRVVYMNFVRGDTDNRTLCFKSATASVNGYQ